MSTTPFDPLEPFGVALVPGRFDAPDEAWVERIAAAAADDIKIGDGRRIPVVKIVLTETTDRNLPDQACPEGWKWHRLWEPYGASNISILTNRDRFRTWSPPHTAAPYAELLTDDTLWTAKGNLRPPYYAEVLPWCDKHTGHTGMTAGAHQPLSNTARRALAHDEAIATTPKVFRRGRDILGPDAVRLLAADWNVSVTNAVNAAEWLDTFPGFTPTWLEDSPEWKRLIDFQAGGRGLVHLGTEWHRRPHDDPFDHPWSCTAWGYRLPALQPPDQPEPTVEFHDCPLCGFTHQVQVRT